ncbi:hypothetical protein ACLPJK_26560 [Pseudomonas aeruginosa]|uniref:hypothetical protein n=1 Tax=Pseudomonas aeruginosa TaxID=287 RepID=UPI003D2A8521
MIYEADNGLVYELDSLSTHHEPLRNIKRPEFTYGVHPQALADIVPDNRATILSDKATVDLLRLLDGAVMGSVRAYNDEHELLRQAIAYTLTYKLGNDGEIYFAVYCRAKHGDGELVRRYSLGAGGHVEREDVAFYVTDNGTEVIDLTSTLVANCVREHAEEIHFPTNTQREPRKVSRLGFVMDSGPSGYVGNVHFGVIHAIRVVADEFQMSEEQNEAVGWMRAIDLVNHDKALGEFEPWSAMIIAQIHKVCSHLRFQSYPDQGEQAAGDA